MNTVSRSTKITIGVLILCAVVAPLVLGIDNNYLINILCSYCYFGIMCCSLNLLLGAACCKLNAIFLAMTTVGFYKAVSTFIVNEGWLTGGATGIPAIAKWSFFGVKLRNWQFYYISLAVLLLVFLFCYRLVRSKTGRAMQAMCSAPIAASAMGVDITRLKFLVCGISGALAGLAGVLYAVTNSYLSADMFSKVSISTLAMTVVGGMGTLWGPVLGTLTITTLPELLRPFANHLDFVYGLVIILSVIFMPGGIYGFIRIAIENAARKRAQKPVAAKKGE